MDNRATLLGYLSAALQFTIIGFSFLFVVMALEAATPIDLLAYRFVVAFLAACVPVLFGWWRPSLRLRDIVPVLPLAVFYPSAFFALQTWGLVHLPTAEAGIISAFVPIITLVLASVFLGERTTLPQKLFVLLSVGGVVFISAMTIVLQTPLASSASDNIGALNEVGMQRTAVLGVLLILGSAFSMSCYNVLARRLTQTFPVPTMTFIMTALACIAFLALSLGNHAINGTLSDYFAPLASPKFVMAVLYLGVLSSLGTSFLGNFALSKIQASKLGVFGNFSVVVTIFAGYFILHESLYWYHLVGALAILTGVIGTNLVGRRSG